MLKTALYCLVALVSASGPYTMKLHGYRRDWSQIDVELGERAQSHSLLFAVKQAASDELLTEKLLSVSDPRSPTFGQHLSFEQIGELVANPTSTKAVQSYLESIGATITRVTPHGEYVRASAPISVWNNALQADFRLFAERETQRQIVRTTTYTIPSALAEHVAFVGYTVELPPSRIPKFINMKPTAGAGGVDPMLLQTTYGITGKGSAKSTQAVFEGDDQNYSPSDLAGFFSYYLLPDQKIAKDIGGHNKDAICLTNPNDCGEANLDTQYILAVAPGAPTTYWYINNDTSPFVAWAEAVAADPDAPLVHSISYGEIEQNMDHNLLDMFNTEAQKLGLRGITIVVASGDDGANSFLARQNKTACGLSPSFPASNPWVLAVGATQGPENYQPERAETSDHGGIITSGGGFSTYWPQPAYQQHAVSTYLQTVSPKPSFPFNHTNRGYPDVAMLGHMYNVQIAGFMRQVSGTSAAAPVVAGMISLANAKRLAKGDSPLGFINVQLYTNSSSVCTDITEGVNNCCAGLQDYMCCPDGYSAFKGWDPVTGFGSVNYGRFAAAFVH